MINPIQEGGPFLAHMRIYRYYLIIICVALISAGCATRSAYFKLDSSLAKDIRSFNGTQYVPLVKLCDTYNLDWKWDTFIKKATIQKGSNRIVLLAGSDMILVNGVSKKLDRPVLFDAGAVFVPLSLARNYFGELVGPGYAGITPPKKAAGRFAIKTIVIDPGHGGKAIGARSRKFRLKEKDMTLSMAKMMKNILEGEGLKVIMTRTDDRDVSLSKRAAIANRSGADLFVSVHMNASTSRSLKGFECYFLSNAMDDNARALQAFENGSLKIDKEASAEHSRRLDRTLWDLTLTEDRRESAELASYICDSVLKFVPIGNRGIRAARFYVLKYIYMPSVLVETGYISNRYDGAKLKDPEFLAKMADAVSSGILKYKEEYERTEGFTRN